MKKNRLEMFFSAINELFAAGSLLRGKDFNLVEYSTHKELQLHMESIYPKYQQHVDSESLLSFQDLRSLLDCSSSFMVYKTASFEWKEEINDKVNKTYSVSVCAPILNYSVAQDRYNIDLERYTIREFETALLAKGIPSGKIEEMLKVGSFVYTVFGYVGRRRCKWNGDGKCFQKNGTPYPQYNLKFY